LHLYFETAVRNTRDDPYLVTSRTRKREDLLQATEAELMKIAKATTRARNRLKGTEAIALRVGRVIDHYKMGKHFELSITDSSFTWTRKAEQIRQEAALDGLYVVRTSVPAQDLPAEAAVTAYKGLAVVERAFRSLKTVDLQVRPVFHWNAQRVRAHVFLCMLAYYVEWHMRETLQLPNVTSRAETLRPCAVQDQRDDTFVLAYAFQQSRQLTHHRMGQRIECGGSVQRDDRNAIYDARQYIAFRSTHRCCVTCRNSH